MVDFPAPVAPVMANIPAEHSGSAVKSISVVPSSEARFLMRMASIFIIRLLDLFPVLLVEKVAGFRWVLRYCIWIGMFCRIRRRAVAR
ncbi:hypothetical protein D9M72_338390 [compost metagenome]